MRPITETPADISSAPPAKWRDALIRREAAAWSELVGLVESLTPEQAERPGYFAEGWSAKDALAHIGSWLAEAGLMLYRICAGTYRHDDVDIDALNQVFFETERYVEFEVVRAQCWAARARMMQVLAGLATRSPEALWWFAKAGPDHYAEHVPRLREWIEELRKS